jgi:hypothetical protein
MFDLNTMKTQLNELIKRWEECAKTCYVLAGNAAETGIWSAQNRCKIRASMFRTLALEVNQEIQADDQRQREHHPIMHCPDCGEFRNLDHVCKIETKQPQPE